MHSNAQTVPYYSHHPRKRGSTRHAIFAILGLLVMMAGYTILVGEDMQMEAKSIDGRRISRDRFAIFRKRKSLRDGNAENINAVEPQPPAIVTSNEAQSHGDEDPGDTHEQIKAHTLGKDFLPMQNLEHGLVQPAQWRVVENGMTATDPMVGEVKFNYVHMAMIAEKPDQRLVLAFQASGVLEAAEDQRIWVMVSKDTEGKQWGEPRALLPSRRKGAQWAPVLHWSARDSLFYLFYAESDPNCLRPGNPRRYSVGGTISVTTAADPLPGETSLEWGKPRGIYRQREGEMHVPKIIANRLVELSSGEWILPFWRQRSYKVCETKSPNAAGVLRSSDNGKSWKAYGELTLPMPMGHWVIEGSVVELGGGAIMMLLRSTEGFIYTSRSLDKGIIWSTPEPTALLNPDSKTHAIRLRGPQGLLLLAYNNHDRPFHGMAKGRTSVSGKRRDTLMMAVSPDKGESWKQVARLDPPAHVVPVGNQTVNMMFHYPTLLHRASGKVLASYSRSYYPDRSAAQPPHQDGIWLAEIDLVAAMKQ